MQLQTACSAAQVSLYVSNLSNVMHRCEDESIDELAAFLGVGEEVAAMTAKYASHKKVSHRIRWQLWFKLQMLLVCSAMGGSVKFEDALKMRLAVMNTSSQNIQDFLAAHPPRISQGAY